MPSLYEGPAPRWVRELLWYVGWWEQAEECASFSSIGSRPTHNVVDNIIVPLDIVNCLNNKHLEEQCTRVLGSNT